jgi:chromosome segregation protein
VHFQRLRLSGFKSFVEPVEFRIEAGLTGVVGPNGCGKSNLLEALRWVMGANSAKAMRAGGMDDVIFAGSGVRPSRNHAEVALTIDNADGAAPGKYAREPVIEVVRRIDRGAGSTFRINGREVRARDVQLLFADASTGANSPALVRQGQISELIAAKPQNRRMILEEAGGVSGLHGRRHEAELRLRAAEANIARLDDVARELEAMLARLKREARQAEKYKRLAAEIRILQGAVLFARWKDGADILERTNTEAEDAGKRVGATAGAAAAAAAAALQAEQALAPLRDAAQVAGAVLHRLAIENDRLEQAARQAALEVERLSAERARLDADRERETHTLQDGQAALARLAGELAELEDEIASAPERLPALEQAWRAADAERVAAEGRLESLAAEAAAAEAERRGLDGRLADAHNRLARAQRALDAAKTDRAAVGPPTDPKAAEIGRRADEAAETLRKAKAALAAAEAAHGEAVAAETAARTAAREVDDRLGVLNSEANGLARLTAPAADNPYPPVLDQVAAKAGYEAALAAALGDDLDAALDARAAAYWRGAKAAKPSWPAGAEPLAGLIEAPAALAARLAFIAVVDRALGERLQPDLEPGCRLVSREGDLWRWDGLVSRAEAPRPAAVRLAQRTRLSDLQAQIAALLPRSQQVTDAHQAAVAGLRAAEEGLRAARKAPEAAEQALSAARAEIEQRDREAARRDARAQSLDEMIVRFEADRLEAETGLETARAEQLRLASADDLTPQVAETRAAAAVAREAAAQARAALDGEIRECAGRDGRLAKLRDDHADWSRRTETATARLEALAGQRTLAEAALDQAREAPAVLETRRAALLDELGVAEQRQAVADDALAAAEAARAAGDRASRAADAEAAGAREHRAAAAARLEAAQARLIEIADALREATRLEPEALGAQLDWGAIALQTDAEGIERRLTHLERERDAIGPVNLLAEDEARDYDARLSQMRAERADLASAIARLREGIEALNSEGRERLLAAFEVINGHFQALFQALFGGGQAELRLVESDDPLEAGLEIYACPPGKRLAAMSLMSGGEQALTAAALIFGVFLANPAPICVLDEVDAPLDDANVERFCNLLNEMRNRTQTRFIAITHNPVTMAKMDRLYGVTMPERGVSQLVSVDLGQAEAMAAQ